MFFNVPRFIFGNPPPRLAEQWQICCQNWRKCQRWFLNVPSCIIIVLSCCPMTSLNLSLNWTAPSQNESTWAQKKHNGPISHRGKLQLSVVPFSTTGAAHVDSGPRLDRPIAAKLECCYLRQKAGCDGTDVSCMSV